MEIEAIDYSKLFRMVLARFEPKRRDNLRDYLFPLIGTVTVFECSDCSSEDDPYPGQYRWVSNDARFKCRWVPEEDLVILADLGRRQFE